MTDAISHMSTSVLFASLFFSSTKLPIGCVKKIEKKNHLTHFPTYDIVETFILFLLIKKN